MKGDFTKLTFQPEKHYTSVRMQQGRLQLDSDWNEQVDIQNHLRHTQTVDLIGADSGVPTSEGNSENPKRDSFNISVIGDGTDLAIAPGRLYVNGTLCELEGTLFDFELVSQSSSKQIKVFTLSVDGRNLEKDQWVELYPDASNSEKECFQITNIDTQKMELTLSKEVTANSGKMRRLLTYRTQPNYPKPDKDISLKDGIYLAYIDVWQRHITTIEDPKLREVALINSPDTATRSQTVWQLKLLEKTAQLSLLEPIKLSIQEHFKNLSENVEENLEQQFNLIKNFSNILDSMVIDKTLNQPNRDLIEQQFKQLIETKQVGEEEKLNLIKNLNSLIENLKNHKINQEWKSFINERKGRLAYMNACAELCNSAGVTSDSRGYQRLENQLYRVEIHDSGKLAENNNKPTFKWSRENGSIASAIEKIEDNIITIPKSIQDAWASSQTGQWLEITNEEMELKGEPGVMVRLLRAFDNKIEFDRSTITNNKDSIFSNPSKGRKVRRWDHITKESVITAEANWIPLEAGIKVKFEFDKDKNSVYETGDYWLIPARSATNDIEWPNDQADKKIRKPLPQPRQGIQHDYCLLALVEVKAGKFEQQKEKDLRVIFPPLVRCADKSEVESQFATVNATLETKADKSEVESQFATVNSTLETKADKSEVESQFATVNSTLETKADKSEVDSEFATVNSTLETKADKSEVESQFATVNSTLENKANKNGDIQQEFNARSIKVETSIYAKNLNSYEINSKKVLIETEAISGGFYQVSSRVLKQNIQDLSSQEVAAIFRSLNPVKFIYKEDEAKTLHAGFIAEDTPELLTANDKQSIKVVDIVAILTKVVQDNRKTLGDLVKLVKRQQAEIADLTQKVKLLEEKTEQ
ncbi:DUF6519 domain-containing protein [Aerosakkonemataceae cyanobacterium BLCC-F50]|uniref:DUF6519 domain-containing protein n=1 Tax=Floridaenema flaviceps BLCC-F50 TaxID=3153642 RepID=A0ABV4XSZ9_9CYAN